MKVVEECHECIVNRARGILNRGNVDQNTSSEITDEISKIILSLTPGDTWLLNSKKIICPAQLGSLRQQRLEKLGIIDTYEFEKKQGLQIGSYFLDRVDNSLDMKTAMLYSLFGNGIEFDVGGNTKELHAEKLWNECQQFLHDKKIHQKINHILNLLEERMKPSNLILFLLDNVGEHYLDSLLITALRAQNYNVEVVIKGKPVLNDLSKNDSSDIFQGLKIWDTENSDVGLFLSRIPENLRKRIHQADLLIIKGMAQFETLSSEILDVDALYLFKAKCQPVAEITGNTLNDFVVHFQEAGSPWLN